MSDMTREEAIEVIEQDIPCEHDRDLIEALGMAISALSTDGEYIKKEDTINRIRECAKEYIRGAKDSLTKGDDETFSWLEYVVQAHKNIEYGVEELPTYSFPDSADDNTMEWIYKPHIYGVDYCSKCGYENTVADTKFCPNCGRKAVNK